MLMLIPHPNMISRMPIKRRMDPEWGYYKANKISSLNRFRVSSARQRLHSCVPTTSMFYHYQSIAMNGR